jgi:methylthioribose-1-phosphate isomerase
MKYSTIKWEKNKIRILDQRLLPGKLKVITCSTAKDIFEAIRNMKIRGAPAIGVAGAYGVYLGIKSSKAASFKSFKKDLDKVIIYLAGARPTARNLFWALERISYLVQKNHKKEIKKLKQLILKEAHLMLREDVKINRLIGENGKKLIGKNFRILTHCNAGALATAGYGTALGVIFSAKKKIKQVYVDETRPRLQGARLTMWELINNKVPSTLICDNTAASLMAKRKIDAVIVGADRIASNGDAANKIGTYSLAVLAAYHGIPFYIAAPFSTFDLSLSSGKKIPIEERSPLEVKKINGKHITIKTADAINFAFDVTPAKLITAIITEKGIIKKPDKKKIKRISL